MGYWTEGDLPFWYQLARTFPIGIVGSAHVLVRRLFTGTRRFLVAGTANGVITDGLRQMNKPPNGTIFQPSQPIRDFLVNLQYASKGPEPTPIDRVSS